MARTRRLEALVAVDLGGLRVEVGEDGVLQEKQVGGKGFVQGFVRSSAVETQRVKGPNLTSGTA